MLTLLKLEMIGLFLMGLSVILSFRGQKRNCLISALICYFLSAIGLFFILSAIANKY